MSNILADYRGQCLVLEERLIQIKARFEAIHAVKVSLLCRSRWFPDAGTAIVLYDAISTDTLNMSSALE